MELYFINLSLVLIWGLFQEYFFYSDRLRHFFSGCIIVQLILFSVLRNEVVGPDTIQYIGMFDIYKNIDISSFNFSFIDVEPGYILLNYLIGLISDDSRVFLVFMGVLILLPFAYFIEKYSPRPWLGYYIFICLGFYNNSMFIYRQFMAIAVLIFALNFVVKRKLIYYICCVILAICFHRTALAFTPIYWIYPLRISNSYLIRLFAISLLVGLSGNALIKYANSFARIHYEIGYTGGLNYLLMLILIGATAYAICKTYYTNKKYKLFFHMLFIAIVCQILSLQMELFIRVVYYYVYSLTIVIPCIVYSNKLRKNRSLVLFLTCIFFAIVYWSNLQGEWTVAYKFMWEK